MWRRVWLMAGRVSDIPATGDYFTPMQGQMLWVYEGLTQYLGSVLAARSGLRGAEEARDNLATVAAQLDANRGRAWRPLVDTGTHAQDQRTQAAVGTNLDVAGDSARRIDAQRNA